METKRLGSNYGGWNLFTYAIDGTTSAKYYINGVEWNTDTSYGGTIGANSRGLNILSSTNLLYGSSVKFSKYFLRI